MLSSYNWSNNKWGSRSAELNEILQTYYVYLVSAYIASFDLAIDTASNEAFISVFISANNWKPGLLNENTSRMSYVNSYQVVL